MDLVLMSKITGNLITAKLQRKYVVLSWGGIDHCVTYERFVSNLLLNKKIYRLMGEL